MIFFFFLQNTNLLFRGYNNENSELSHCVTCRFDVSYILESGLQAEEEGQSLLQQMQQTQVQEERANKGIA